MNDLHIYLISELLLLWQVVAEFEELWNNGLIQGWQNENHENGDAKQPEALIDLDYYSTVEQLMEVGPGKLKEVRLHSIRLCCILIKTLSMIVLESNRHFVSN